MGKHWHRTREINLHICVIVHRRRDLRTKKNAEEGKKWYFKLAIVGFIWRHALFLFSFNETMPKKREREREINNQLMSKIKWISNSNNISPIQGQGESWFLFWLFYFSSSTLSSSLTTFDQFDFRLCCPAISTFQF